MQKLALWLVSIIAVVLMSLFILLVIENNSQRGTIEKLTLTKDSLSSKISILEIQRDKLNDKLGSLVSGYRLLLKEKALSDYAQIPSNLGGLHEGIATVVYRRQSCDYFILENASGYIIAEWIGGYDPDLGDKITGNFSEFGIMSCYDETMGSGTDLWIDDYMLDKGDAMEKLNDDCE